MDNFFGSNSKSSLQETIRGQQERLAKYEKKLGDLVKAYKILQEEKNALQETVTALSSQQGNEDATVETDDAAEDTLKQQVATLTRTLTSLNETKSTLESRFQSDKKVLLEQVETLKSAVVAEEARTLEERNNHEISIKTMKNKLRHEQSEREQEQTHHVAMLRELQHMLAAERNANQRLELELDELRNSRNYDQQRALFEEKLALANEEKQHLTTQLAELRTANSKPTDSFILLQEENMRLKGLEVELEDLRSQQESSVYNHLHFQTTADQTRIRDLENRLTELSDLIADYDATQKRDQTEITRLQKRVTSLESENRAASVSVSVNTNIVIDQPPTTPPPPPQEKETSLSERSLVVTPLQTLPSRTVREAEVRQLKDSLRIFKQEVRTLQEEKKIQHQNLVRLTEEQKEQLNELSAQHQLEISELEKGHALRLSELQESSAAARTRAQQLLQEREEEIQELRSKMEKKSEMKGSDVTVLGELLSSVETDNVPRTLIFYKQQYKFISDELNKSKKARDTVEQSLREKERNEHIYVSEIANLKQEIRRQIRNSSRESANLEYLKNIVLRYLRATSGSEKRQILLAIFTVLEFNDEEKESVKHKLAPGWFS